MTLATATDQSTLLTAVSSVEWDHGDPDAPVLLQGCYACGDADEMAMLWGTCQVRHVTYVVNAREVRWSALDAGFVGVTPSLEMSLHGIYTALMAPAAERRPAPQKIGGRTYIVTMFPENHQIVG